MTDSEKKESNKEVAVCTLVMETFSRRCSVEAAWVVVDKKGHRKENLCNTILRSPSKRSTKVRNLRSRLTVTGYARIAMVEVVKMEPIQPVVVAKEEV